MTELRELEELMDQVRKRSERRCRKLQSEIDSYKVDLARMTDAYAAADKSHATLLANYRDLETLYSRMRVERTEQCEDVAACQRTIHGLSTGQKVAFAAGWQNATGYYSGKQIWNLERCWEQFLKDKEEVAK